MNRHTLQRTIILARHGQTTWNLDGRYQGQSDPPLCRTGITECASLADGLGGLGIRSVFTSPLNRARQTAQIVADRLKINAVEDDPRLVELHFGEWEGLTQTQIRQRWPDLLKTWKIAPDSVRFPGGETLHEASGRLRSFLLHVASLGTRDESPVLVITHTGLIRLAVRDARRQEGISFRQVAVAPASAWRFVLSTDGGMAPVLELTDSSTGEHLQAPGAERVCGS